jgi:hypothetical protein
MKQAGDIGNGGKDLMAQACALATRYIQADITPGCVSRTMRMSTEGSVYSVGYNALACQTGWNLAWVRTGFGQRSLVDENLGRFDDHLDRIANLQIERLNGATR